MRKLVLTRGHPGSGKSHALAMAGLADWTLSSDAVRALVASPYIDTLGRTAINQMFNPAVFALLNRLAEERMARGETLAIDSVMIEHSDAARWVEMARTYRYETVLLDMSGISLDVALARNAARGDMRRVPESTLADMHRVLSSVPPRTGEGIRVIQGKEDGSHVGELSAWLAGTVPDLSGYRQVVHVGDIQGCYSVLAGPGGPLEAGLRDDTFYVFIGDLLDRGTENGEVMRWYLDHVLGRGNAVLLHGNHEDHLDRWARGLEPVSNEFALRTLPQLVAAGVTAEDADAVCASARDYFRYSYDGKDVLASHGGLSTFPQAPHLVSLKQFVEGTGNWTDPVDAQFERNSMAGYQVHGHRNHGSVPARATARSFNLEDAVEFGGNLRTCTLDHAGWTTANYRNTVFRSLRDRTSLETVVSPHRKRERKLMPHWMLADDGKTREFDPQALEAMLSHPGVQGRDNETYPHIQSLNFTRKVFYDKSWDDVVVKARGLFYDRHDKTIISKGYDKFFNIGERPETTVEALLENVVFPLEGYVKENGFLGILGYDRRTDSLFVSSKSNPDSPFAGWFRTILRDGVGEQGEERLRRYLRDNECSMTFEVIDPVNDPHMIAYDAPKAVLLDIIRCATEFEKASYETVVAVGAEMGLETKRRDIRFQTPLAFGKWLEKVDGDVEFKVDSGDVEGFVFEDASGFMTKWKSPYYDFWKGMRGQKERMVIARNKGTDFVPKLRRPDGEPLSEREETMAEAFLDWCAGQDTDTLKLDIITLRGMFGHDFGNDPVSPAPGR